MIHIIEAIIDEAGHMRLAEPIRNFVIPLAFL